MAFCRNCGQHVDDTDMFCAACGTAQTITEHMGPTSESDSQNPSMDFTTGTRHQPPASDFSDLHFKPKHQPTTRRPANAWIVMFFVMAAIGAGCWLFLTPQGKSLWKEAPHEVHAPSLNEASQNSEPAAATTPAVTISAPTEVADSLANLPEQQRIALQEYLRVHPDFRFIHETAFGKGALEWFRTEPYFGPTFHPYYRSGDFNHDGKVDFAVIVVGRPTTEVDYSVANSIEYHLRVLVFNGSSTGYKLRLEEPVDAPLIAFIHVPPEGGDLFFGVSESDAYCFILAPTGQGYTAKGCSDDDDEDD